MAIALPFLLVAALEGILRLAGYGRPEPLIVRVTEGPFDVYSVNGKVGRRYFPPAMERIMPKPGFRIFPVKKDPSTLRIFVLGESTTAGFPFHTHGAFSGFLEDRLTRLLPLRRVEVINCAMTAVNSYAVEDFVRELRGYEPDLFLLYVGHNEYYGALGPGSAVAFGRNPAAIRGLRALVGLRIVHLLQAAVQKLRGPPAEIKGKTVMQAMAGRTDIRWGDSIYRAGIDGFEENLRGAIEAAGNVPVVLCEVVSNLSDQPPFGSSHSPGLPPAQVSRFSELLARSRSLLASGDSAAARVGIGQALALDSTFAEVRFLHGRLLQAEGRRDVAFEEYRAARDHDVIRFRAPSEAQEVLRRVAAQEGAHLVPLESAFRQSSESGIPGRDLFFEHVHPRLRGQQLIAEAVLQLLVRDNLVAPAPDWRWEADLTPAEYLHLSGITPLDEEIADQRIHHLTHKWPFLGDPRAPYASAREPKVAELAKAFLDDRLDLAEAHARLGQSYLEEGRLEPALAEYTTVCKIFPVVPAHFAQAGQILLRLGRPAEAVQYLGRACELDPATRAYSDLLTEARRLAGP